jgi:NADH-quinone oxidoreductase subunit N
MLNLTEFFFPEFYLSFALLAILTYATIFSSKSGLVSFPIFLNFLASFSLLLTLPMLYMVPDVLSLIKTIIVITAIIVINLPNKLKNIEFTILVLISVLGLNIIISSNDLIMLYLGIELLSLSLYILAAIKRNSEYSTEAGLKYFILGAVASGLYLFGCVLIYLKTGSTSYIEIENYITYDTTNNIGAIFIIIALLFKLAAAPFHM